MTRQLELADRLAEARALWIEVEILAGELHDEALDAEVHLARYGIVGARDRLAQLRATRILDGLELLRPDPDEAAA